MGNENTNEKETTGAEASLIENTPSKPRLNLVNYFQLPAYLLNVLVNFVYGMGSSNEDVGDVSDQYQTIVTPAGWAFSIWSVIFIMQGIFVIVQFLPAFRASPMVQKGVWYYYVLACLFQSGWVFAFTNHVIWLSFLLIVLIWVSLLAIVITQYYGDSDDSCREYWLLVFPFSIHCAWITAASLLNGNVLLVDAQVSAPIQLAAGIISLAILHAISVYTLFGINEPDDVFAFVFMWATAAISQELSNPKDMITNKFSSDTIEGVKYAAATVSTIIAIQIVVSWIQKAVKKCLSKRREGTEVELVTALPAEESNIEAQV